MCSSPASRVFTVPLGKVDLQNLELEVSSLNRLILELLPGTHQPGRGDGHRWSIARLGEGVLYLKEGNLQAGNVHNATEVCLMFSAR